MPDAQLTKKALAEAMKDLMKDKPMDKISVSEITSRCHMSRKSFYYHFKDKYDLVNWIYYTEFLSKMQKTDIGLWELLEKICSYFYENRVFYGNALRVQVQNSFSDYFTEGLCLFIVADLDSVLPEHESKVFFASYLSEAIRLAVTKWLIDEANMPPKRFVSLLQTVICGIAKKTMCESC